MKIPSVALAESLLAEAEKLNPGAWVAHNRTAGKCARIIADQCADLDGDVGYILGLLHDIGRRYGVCDMRHIILGYQFMHEQGFDDSARICLTHSFPYKNIDAYTGENDYTDEESTFIQKFIDEINYDDYDRLIQLCDAVSFPTGATYMEKRLVDVVMRRGFNELTLHKWKAFFTIKDYFDVKAGCDIYKLIL
jgi:hypothetical protein